MNELVMGVYDVEYYWIDGYDTWNLDFVRVVAKDEEHALELATVRVACASMDETVRV